VRSLVDFVWLFSLLRGADFEAKRAEDVASRCCLSVVYPSAVREKENYGNRRYRGFGKNNAFWSNGVGPSGIRMYFK